MKIIYVHHALRDIGNPPSQDDKLTKLGIKDAKICAKLLKFLQKRNKNIKAIYSSPFYRCVKTAEIINKQLNLPLHLDSRLNEFKSVQDETWTDLQKRMKEVIKDILNKYTADDCVICVTSGVNVVGFTNAVYKTNPSDQAPFIGIPSCSPLMFDIKDC